MPPRRQLDDADMRFVERQILRAYPDRTEEILVVASLEIRPAAEDREAELLAGGRLPHPVVAVEVVVELVERTVSQTPRIRLDAHHLSVFTGPGPHASYIVEPPMVVSPRIEFIIQVVHVLEGDFAVDVHVDAEADLDGRETLPDNGGDERRGRGQMFGEESVGIHFLQHRRHVVGERLGNRDVPIAVCVEDRVKFNAVLPRPAEIRDNPRTPRRRPVVHRTTGGHARPRKEDLLDP